MPISRSMQHEHRGLQPFRQIEGLRREFEGFARVLRQQHDVLGVAVGRIGAVQHIGLLGAGRHAGGRPGALHVENHARNFREIRQPAEFLHQRDAGAGGGGEGAGAVPPRPHHDADRGDLVLGLDDGVVGLAGVLVVAQLGAIAGKGVGQRRRGRERIPRAHGGAAIDGAERGGLVALEKDAVAHLVGAPDFQPAGALEAGLRLHIEQHPVAAEMQRMLVGADQLFLALVLLQEQRLDHFRLDAEQRRQRAEVNNILEQLALARVGIFAVGRWRSAARR